MRIDRLRREIDDFRRTLFEVLGTDSREWPSEARHLCAGESCRSAKASCGFRRKYRRSTGARSFSNADIASLYRATQRRVWQTVGLALVASVAIALLATLYAGRLEQRLERQRARDVETARDLQRLRRSS